MFSKIDLKNHPITVEDLKSMLAEIEIREGSEGSNLHSVMLNLIRRALVSAVANRLGSDVLENDNFGLGAAMADYRASEFAIDLLQEDGVDIFDPDTDVLSVYNELSELGMKAALKGPDEDGMIRI